MKVLILGLLGLFTLTKTWANETVFVAGGSGRTGLAIVEVLSEAGYEVRASTRNAARARQRHGSGINWVEMDLHDTVAVKAAVEGADIVVSTVGHGDFVGIEAPQFVGYLAVRNLVDAAKAANVKHMIVITSSTAGHLHGRDHRNEARFGFVLYWKTKGEDYLIASGLPYTFIGPGGLADDFLVSLIGLDLETSKRWGVKILARPDYERAFVSRVGVAHVIREAIENPQARNKAVAVVWDDAIPAGSISGSFAEIPEEHPTRSYYSP